MGQLKSFFYNQPKITGETGRMVRETLVRLQVKPEVIAGVIVNGILQSKDFSLLDEDSVKLFAVMGGG
jgi:menaquinone-dependent protoporphyrinogen IX oxidase